MSAVIEHDRSREDHTPLMQQYVAIKQEHADALLLFQVGDFYELFFDDAKAAAGCLGIALTARGKMKGEPIPLCGVPIHAADHYVSRLIKAGFKVALCTQLEEAVPGKVVKRGVTQVLTPGMLTDEKLLDEKSPSYLLSFFSSGDIHAFVFGELLTAQLFMTVSAATSERSIESELSRFFPDEVIMPQHKNMQSFAPLFKKLGYFTSFVAPLEDERVHSEQVTQSWMSARNNTAAQQACSRYEALRLALLYFYVYADKNQFKLVPSSWQVNFYEQDEFLQLDAATQRNLELVVDVHGGKKHTVCGMLDQAITPMGSRLIKKWIMRPLVNQAAIEQRHEVVATLIKQMLIAQEIMQLLKKCGDLERVVGRIALRRAPLHDYQTLERVLGIVPQLMQTIMPLVSLPLVHIIAQSLQGFEQLWSLLHAACAAQSATDQLIASGFDAELDELRARIAAATHKLFTLEKAEQERTGINSLKVGYNHAHGYYIEVTKTNLHLVPADYVRYQTLVGKERYITTALQQLQQEIVSAQLAVKQKEEQIIERIKQEVYRYIHQLRKLSHALAHLDALLSFAQVAHQFQYVRPSFTAHREITIREGRHPIIERVGTGRFIVNDTIMHDQASLFIITGPNMGGKSTYLRQVALLSIMAQCGSFVAASFATVPLLDRIFTRIGAGDDLAQGKSTFWVEMEETATICTQATNRSLVILDEVGRGTSTFDGLAIAQAVVEYLHTKIGCFTLFATHYQELTRLTDTFPAIINWYAASKKTETGILFLYKMIRGVAQGSFGIEVARLAQLPKLIVDRAQELAHSFCQTNQAIIPACVAPEKKENSAENVQDPALFAIKQQLAAIDCDQISPRQALDILWQLKKHYGNDT